MIIIAVHTRPKGHTPIAVLKAALPPAWIYPMYNSVIAHLDVGSQRGNQTEARAEGANSRIVTVINYGFRTSINFATRPFLRNRRSVQSIAVGARRVERYVTVTPWRARVSAGPHRACALALAANSGARPFASKRPRGSWHASHLRGLGSLTVALRLRVRDLVGRPSRAADTENT